MRRRRGFFLAASVLAAAVAIASACSFPEPALVGGAGADEGGSSSSSSSGGDADGSDVSVPVDAPFDSVFAIDGNQNVDPDGASQEASVAPDAGLVDAMGCDACDCDMDNVKNKDAAVCGNTGNDCNDLDPFIPHDGFVASRPEGHDGDWNCDGVVTKQFPVNVRCDLLTDCKAQGFKTDPACGATGEYIFCTQVLLTGLCVEDTAKMEARAQGCK